MRGLVDQHVTGILCADYHFAAHRVLWDRGILHRDISAANVLIRLVPEYITDKNPHELRVHEFALERTEGFLVDFEYAAFLKDLEKDRTAIDHQGRVQKDTETGSTVVKYHPVRIPVPPKEPGEGMTVCFILDLLLVDAQSDHSYFFTAGNNDFHGYQRALRVYKGRDRAPQRYP